MISICAIIVTHRRAQWLDRCVRSLQAAALDKEEIDLCFRIVLNGEDPLTRLKTEAISRDDGFRLDQVLSLRTGISPASARNLALVGLTADWACFLDDDAFVENDYFARFLQARSCFPDAAAIGGPNLTPLGSTPFQEALGRAYSTRFATFHSVARYRPLGEMRAATEDDLILCNLFVHSSALRPNFFPEGWFCGEENLALRDLERAGREMIYSPELIVRHERRQGPLDLFKQCFLYGQSRGRGLRREPGGMKLAHFVPSLCAAFGLASTVSGLFSGSWNLAFIGLCTLYLALCGFFGLFADRGKTPAVILLTPPLFPIIHTAYGLGWIAGLMGFAGP